MSTKRLLKKLDQYERELEAEAKQPLSISFGDDLDKIEEEERILYVENVNADAYQNLAPLTPADQSRYLLELGL